MFCEGPHDVIFVKRIVLQHPRIPSMCWPIFVCDVRTVSIHQCMRERIERLKTKVHYIHVCLCSRPRSILWKTCALNCPKWSIDTFSAHVTISVTWRQNKRKTAGGQNKPAQSWLHKELKMLCCWVPESTESRRQFYRIPAATARQKTMTFVVKRNKTSIKNARPSIEWACMGRPIC